MTGPKYPSGALVRISDICGNPKLGQKGLLPISRGTWYNWLKQGKVPPGRRIPGTTTTVWPIEVVLGLAA